MALVTVADEQGYKLQNPKAGRIQVLRMHIKSMP
jgi:hypothetical protein